MVSNLMSRMLQKLAFIAPGGFTLRPALHRWMGVNIGKGVWLSQFVYLDELHPGNITIEDNCSIGLRTTILSHFYWGPRQPEWTGSVLIERNVFVGPHCLILPNVKIGEGSVIKAGTVVSKSVPPHTFFGTRSAEVLGTATVPLTPEHPYEEFARGLRLRMPRERFEVSEFSQASQLVDKK